MMRYEARSNMHGFQVFDTKADDFCLGAWSSREDEATRWAGVLNAQYAQWLADTRGSGKLLRLVEGPHLATDKKDAATVAMWGALVRAGLRPAQILRLYGEG